MKKIFLTSLIILVTSCSLPEVPDEYLVEQSGIVYQIDSDKPYTGKGLSYHSNGQIGGITTYKNGEIIDEESYYDHGQLDYKGTYKNGKISLEEFITQMESSNLGISMKMVSLLKKKTIMRMGNSLIKQLIKMESLFKKKNIMKTVKR